MLFINNILIIIQHKEMEEIFTVNNEAIEEDFIPAEKSKKTKKAKKSKISITQNDSEILGNNEILSDDETNESNEGNVLTLCPFPESINIEVIKEMVNGYMGPREEYYKNKNRSPYIEDEFSEYFTAKASQGEEIGGGHCGTDVKTKDNEGIDAMRVIMDKGTSNEKSLIQNFSSSGSNLDTLFNEKKDEEAVQLFMNDYSDKLKKVKKDKNLKKLYILAYISTNTDIYLACFKMNISKISNVKSAGFVENKTKCVNININNFIDPNIGKVNLYRSKKRVELRLKQNLLNEEHVHKIYSMP